MMTLAMTYALGNALLAVYLKGRLDRRGQQAAAASARTAEGKDRPLLQTVRRALDA
jgi:hypothetical protein